MDLQQTWNKLAAEKLNKPTEKMLPAFTKHSKHPVHQLKRALRTTLGFTIGIGVFFVVLFFVFDHALIRAFVALLVAAYVFAYVYNRKTYKQLNAEWQGAIETNLKESLERIHKIVYTSIRFQEKAAVYVYPISVTCGFLMGLMSGGDSQKFEEDIRTGWIIGVLVVTIIIATPSCFYLSRWMYKISYDKYLKQLKELIDELNKGV